MSTCMPEMGMGAGIEMGMGMGMGMGMEMEITSTVSPILRHSCSYLLLSVESITVVVTKV